MSVDNTNDRAIINSMTKALETKNLILDKALGLARQVGFESISIGDLAAKVGMSKSGLFAHFNSKESLQLMILDYAASEFTKKVTRKAIKSPRGVQRLRALIGHWAKWATEDAAGSCPLISAAIEFDDRPGLVQDKVREHLAQLHSVLKRACEICIEEGEFAKGTDADQVAQEIFSFELSYHIYKKTLKDRKARSRFNKSIDELITRYSAEK